MLLIKMVMSAGEVTCGCQMTLERRKEGGRYV